MVKENDVDKYELKIKELESKVKELEETNLVLQEYFSMTLSMDIIPSRKSPFDGTPAFKNIFNFTIDLKIQKVVWLKSNGDLLGFNEEKLFLKSIGMLSSMLFISADRNRFKSIIEEYTQNEGCINQTILRLKHPSLKNNWVLACFEKKTFENFKEDYLQIQLIKLEEEKEFTNLLFEFIKKSEKSKEYQKVEQLTERQREILVLLGKGLTSKEIADHLNISFHTVEAHRKSIAKKTKTRRRAALISLAAEIGIVR